jgi:hypothetical protein
MLLQVLNHLTANICNSTVRYFVNIKTAINSTVQEDKTDEKESRPSENSS